MRTMKLALMATILITLLPLSSPISKDISGVEASNLSIEEEKAVEILSPIWSISIRRWSDQIKTTAQLYGIDPDLIAAVMNAESNGREYVISRAGAVGLMGVMPSGPGMEWRPLTEELTDPEINLRWGGAILADIIQQSGGDIYSALAAYSGGWDQANRRVPQEYAARVMNEYGQAVAARSGISPEIATHWTVAVEIRRGHVPGEPLLFAHQPVSGLHTYGEHLVYNNVDRHGRALYVKGYAVPLALVIPLETNQPKFDSSDTVELDLMDRLNLVDRKVNGSNPRVLVACLPSLTRLRGRVSTRWYAPSYCPIWHRRGGGGA